MTRNLVQIRKREIRFRMSLKVTGIYTRSPPRDTFDATPRTVETPKVDIPNEDGRTGRVRTRILVAIL